ncbi:hypothetical protein QUA35_05640 [Microcoleus sp. N9_B2]|uniref:hypothetical protein n=1 Tax=unclassified Microcoleus TaxID=2642155 RepID=UPI002FD0FE90
MTDSLLGSLDLLDTDYADILANSNKSAFELQLVKLGVDLTEARTKTKFIALVQHKPETLEELEALTPAWKEACHYKPNALAF